MNYRASKVMLNVTVPAAVFGLVMAAAFSPPAEAKVVAYNFTGVWSSGPVGPNGLPSVAPADTFSGSFAYDPKTALIVQPPSGWEPVAGRIGFDAKPQGNRGNLFNLVIDPSPSDQFWKLAQDTPVTGAGLPPGLGLLKQPLQGAPPLNGNGPVGGLAGGAGGVGGPPGTGGGNPPSTVPVVADVPGFGLAEPMMFQVSDMVMSPVPVPASLPLFASSLLWVAYAGRKRHALSAQRW